MNDEVRCPAISGNLCSLAYCRVAPGSVSDTQESFVWRWSSGGRRVLTMCQLCFGRAGHTLFTSLGRRHMERTLAFECILQGLNPLVLHDGGDTPQMLPEHNA